MAHFQAHQSPPVGPTGAPPVGLPGNAVCSPVGSHIQAPQPRRDGVLLRTQGAPPVGPPGNAVSCPAGPTSRHTNPLTAASQVTSLRMKHFAATVEVRRWPAWKCSRRPCMAHFQAHQPPALTLSSPWRYAVGPPGNASCGWGVSHIQAHQTVPHDQGTPVGPPGNAVS